MDGTDIIEFWHEFHKNYMITPLYLLKFNIKILSFLKFHKLLFGVYSEHFDPDTRKSIGIWIQKNQSTFSIISNNMNSVWSHHVIYDFGRSVHPCWSSLIKQRTCKIYTQKIMIFQKMESYLQPKKCHNNIKNLLLEYIEYSGKVWLSD